VNDNSTLSWIWMVMGGSRYDEHRQAELEQRRALQEQHLEARRGSSRGWLTQLVGFLDNWTARPARALTADFCTAEPCLAA
jgi:hypothetical protein